MVHGNGQAEAYLRPPIVSQTVAKHVGIVDDVVMGQSGTFGGSSCALIIMDIFERQSCDKVKGVLHFPQRVQTFFCNSREFHSPSELDFTEPTSEVTSSVSEVDLLSFKTDLLTLISKSQEKRWQCSYIR